MAEPLSINQIANACRNNPQFINETCGPNGEPPLTSEEKGILVGIIYSKMKKIFEIDGGEMLSEVWPVIKPILAKTNWFTKAKDGEYWLFKKGGPFILCNSICSRAVGGAKKRLTGRTALDDLSNNLLKRV